MERFLNELVLCIMCGKREGNKTAGTNFLNSLVI
jgi:hypothetical protein